MKRIRTADWVPSLAKGKVWSYSNLLCCPQCMNDPSGYDKMGANSTVYEIP